MTVAVVIPLYNHQEFIGAAIDSVRRQSRTVDKLIVVDDGSTDGSVALVESMQIARLELISQQNAGAHAALNRGIEIAATDCDLVAILNSDDVYEPARIEKCVDWLEKNPGLDVVCTNLTLIDSTGNELEKSNPKSRWIERVWTVRKTSLPEWLGIANFLKTSSNIVARSSYLRLHPFRAYRYVHDYFFAVTSALEQKLGLIDEKLLRYRTHTANTIKSEPENLKKETLQMNLDLLRELSSQLGSSSQLRRDYTAYLRNLFQNYADFRAEAFVYALSRVIASGENVIEKMSVDQFPELTEKSGALKTLVAQSLRAPDE